MYYEKRKLILTAIAAIGVVGGALAFKANTFGSIKYCYTTTTASGAVCILTVLNAEFLGSGTAKLKYVTIQQTDDCNPGRGCSKTAKDIGA